MEYLWSTCTCGGLIYTHCVAYYFELAALDCIKGDLYLQEFYRGINKMFQSYFYSPTMQRELHDLSKMLQDQFKQLERLKSILWVASQARALTLMETNCRVLVFDLGNKASCENETPKRAKGYLNFFKKSKSFFIIYIFSRSGAQFKGSFLNASICTVLSWCTFAFEVHKYHQDQDFEELRKSTLPLGKLKDQ